MVDDKNHDLEELIEVDPWFSRSELRIAPDGRGVLIAHARKTKPEGEQTKSECVFCPEQIRKVSPYFPTELIAEMQNKGLYVLQNKFPTFSPPETTDESIRFARTIGFGYERTTARGRHLVMVDTPNHELNPFTDSAETREYYKNLVWGYIKTLRALRGEGFRWGGVGKNRNGLNRDSSVAYAGASQPHPHSQAVGTDLLPPWLEEYTNIYYSSSISDIQKLFREDSDGKMMLGGCGACIEARANRFMKPLTITTNDNYVSFLDIVPADKPPYDRRITIMPYVHQGLFDEMSESDISAFADILHKTMIRVNSLAPNCGYNFELRQSPWKRYKMERDGHLDEKIARLNYSYSKVFHWRFDIYPASAELGSLKRKGEGFMSHLLGIPILTEPPENIMPRR